MRKIFIELAKYTLALLTDKIKKCKRFKDGLQTKIRAPVTASVDWFDSFKLVKVAMRVERCLVDEKKNKIVKENPYGLGTDSPRGGE